MTHAISPGFVGVSTPVGTPKGDDVPFEGDSPVFLSLRVPYQAMLMQSWPLMFALMWPMSHMTQLGPMPRSRLAETKLSSEAHEPQQRQAVV